MKNFLGNAALVIASLLISGTLLFAAGEVYFQFQYGFVPPGPPAEWNVYHARRGWALKPGQYSYFHIQAFRRVDILINDLGVRGEPLSREPQPDIERITILGDSFVFGAALNKGETITDQLQALGGTSSEVANISVPGYGTGQQIRLLEELRAKGYRLGRKLVLVFFTNDIQDNMGLKYSTLEQNPFQPIFSIDVSGNLSQTIPHRRSADGNEKSGHLGQSLFIQFLRYHLEVLFASNPRIVTIAEAIGITPTLPRTPGIVAGWYGPRWETMWQVTDGVLEHLIRIIREIPDGPEPFIAFVPSPFQVHESFQRIIEAHAGSDVRYANFLSDPDRPQRMLQNLARRLDVPFIDMTPNLRQAGQRTLMYFPREGHLNQEGCAVASKIVYDHALRKK